MRSRNERTQKVLLTSMFAVTAVGACLSLVETASAGERKYLVTLASSPKQYPYDTAQPPGGLINKELVRRQYFEENPFDNIGSFAEYWEEISYGDVTISGRATDWILLPWPIQPPLIDITRATPEDGPPVDDPIDDPELRMSPSHFASMNGNAVFEYGMGERIVNTIAASITDYDGDPGGNNNGPNTPPDGSFHETTNAAHPVWKPGERYLDMDNDNKWDALDEANNQMDFFINGTPFGPPDGLPDLRGPWIDLNRDGQGQAPQNCTFLDDSDNDTRNGGFPDCCPNGPGEQPCDCPPTQWTDPQDVVIVDCNGNLVPDAEEIADDETLDQLPFTEEDGVCAANGADGILDECQFVDWAPGYRCRDTGITCGPGDDNPCCDLAPVNAIICERINPPILIPQRCEFHDSNNNQRMDIVEPFENFLRRWDPCLYDPDVSGENNQTDRAHWIKVYDPASPSAGSPLACQAPEYSHDYGNDAYIRDNYPGNAEAIQQVVDMALSRVIWGRHIQEGLVGLCICPDGTPCQTVQLPGGPQSGLCVAGLHAQFDPQDRFINTIDQTNIPANVYSTKYQAAPGSGGQAALAIATPQPGTYPSEQAPQDSAWYPQAWKDRYAVDDDDVPVWPMGFDPNGAPVPGGPNAGRPVPNTLRMVPYADADNVQYDPAVSRRFFKANFGGLNANGTGWTSECGDLAPVIVFETGPLADLGFEVGCNRRILPEETGGLTVAPIFYDGYVEHDDLPSSKYHMAGDQFLGEITSPFRTWYTRGGDPIGWPDAVSPGLDADGEEVLVRIPAIWGDDLGDNIPTTPSLQGDQILLSAGPYAHKLYGSQGRDAGNLLLLEVLTWRTAPPFNNGVLWESVNGTHHPFAGPGTEQQPNENLGFRDYNLDGLLDIGETRPAGSENYLADSDIGTGNTGTNTVYPFNRQRLVEDTIMILDEGLDFDDFADDVALNAVTCGFGTLPTSLPLQFLTEPIDGLQNLIFARGLGSGIVLLPVLAHQANDFPIAPSFYPIHNEDGLGDPTFITTNFPRSPNTPQYAWNIFFHDLVIGIDQQGESNALLGTATFQTPYSAHEYLHSWEGFPDLYDYDVFAPPGPVLNCPIGEFCIMAGGGLVHPVPVLKEKPCTEWIFPVDLTTVLTPGVDTTITLPPYEFVRDASVYFFENENRLGERYYFWSAGTGFDDPAPLPLPSGLPGEGMVVMHTDVGANPEQLPLQQTTYPFTYAIVSADGEDEQAAGTDCGDDGDTWPGVTGNQTFNCDTNPPSRWYNENSCTGISFNRVVPDTFGSVRVTFNWSPTTIPSIKFIDPPGGESVNIGNGIRIYNVRTEATDVYGGTWIRLFRSTNETDRTIDTNGSNYVGMIRKSSPGTNDESLDWNIAGTADGRYFMFADLIPDEGDDGTEAAFSEPRAGRNNEGNGTMAINSVDVNVVQAFGTFGVFDTNTTFSAITPTGDPINFTSLGVQVNDQLCTNNMFRTGNGATNRKPAFKTISGILNGGRTLQLSSAIVPPVGSGQTAVTSWLISKSNRDSRSESWVAECTNNAGTDWRVFSSLTQPQPPDGSPNPDPYPHATTGQQYTSVNGAVKFTITAGSTPFKTNDRFVFVTTGISAHSLGLNIVNGNITESPVAVIEAAPLSGQPPLQVTFDGRDSFDPDGRPLTYRWDFGDGSPISTESLTTHTYEDGGDFTATLRVTNDIGIFGEAQVDVNVANNTPRAVIVASPLSGQAREVTFDGSQSSDSETETDNLIYEWTFGDGLSAGPGDPGEFITTTHFYGTNGTFTATLKVTDEGGKFDTDTVQILVGNTLPIPNITHTTLQGTAPHEVRFNGINSVDPDGDPMTIQWVWGDGSTPATNTYPLTGPPGVTDGTVPHVYNLPAGQTAATFNTTAVVCDNRNPPGCATWPGVTITLSQAGIGASDPRAIMTLTPAAPNLNQQFTANGTLSFDRPAGSTIASYTWNFGDGTIKTGSIVTHTYTTPGNYTIQLTVADGDNPPHTNTASQTVIVTGTAPPVDPDEDNRPPTAILSANPIQGTVGETAFQFNGGASTDPDGDDLTFTWTFGDGETATGAEVTHVYNTVGDFTVRLTVRDENNATSTAVQSIGVLPVGANLQPIARMATGIRTGSVGASLRFDGRTSYDPDGDPLTFEFEFRLDGELVETKVSSSGVVERTFDAEGIYEVTLVVDDGRGGVGSTDPERVTVTARVTPPDNGGSGQDVDGGDVVINDSANQRPGSVCGLGMVMSLFGSLVGLTATAVSRKRRQR